MFTLVSLQNEMNVNFWAHVAVGKEAELAWFGPRDGLAHYFQFISFGVLDLKAGTLLPRCGPAGSHAIPRAACYSCREYCVPARRGNFPQLSESK